MARMALGLSGSFSAMANWSAIFHCIWREMASLAVMIGASERSLVVIASLNDAGFAPALQIGLSEPGAER
jgi:hypothetical protein